MAWTTPIDAYCERIDASYWSEPVNALTNLAFVLAAAVMWRRTAGLALARLLCAVLAVIGIGSWLFHTHANQWSSTADVVPIVVFILLYIFAANLHFWKMRPWLAGLATAGFIPYAALTVPLFRAIPGIGSSAAYMPVPVLILGYAAGLARRAPATARGLAIGAGLLFASLFFRTIDGPVCAALPLGTHFLWHLLNAIMLGWMIEVYRRHMLAERAARG